MRKRLPPKDFESENKEITIQSILRKRSEYMLEEYNFIKENSNKWLDEIFNEITEDRNNLTHSYFRITGHASLQCSLFFVLHKPDCYYDVEYTLTLEYIQSSNKWSVIPNE